MRQARIVAFALALLAPTAHAQGGIETMFDDALQALCAQRGALTSVPLAGGIDIDVPGLDAFGLDLRPLCQYADIVNKSTRSLKDLRDGTFRTTEQFLNQAVAAIAASIGARVGTDKANQAIEALDEQLRAALNSGDGFLSAYREATRDAVEQLREEALKEAEERFLDAQTKLADTNPGATPNPQALRDGSLAYTAVVPHAIDAQAALTAQVLQTEALNQAADELLQQQLENNAYQQTIEDTLRVGVTPEQEGVAQRIVQDARHATSVRQSVNVLTEALASQLRNDAVFTGAVIENLQASARQQAITNHQLAILTTQVIAQQEREIAEAEAQLAADLTTATEELVAQFESFNATVENMAYITDPTPLNDIGFTYCGLFADC